MAFWDVAVVGVDGCREGWIAVVWCEGRADVRFWRSIHEVLDVPDVAVVAIDIPLGLSENGERLADSLARRRLPGRASTIFNAPPRACLAARDDDYDGANELSRRHGAKGISRQSFGLLAKIRELDDCWATAPCRFFEVHPELSFARMNGGAPLAPKRSWAGVISRRELLLARGIDLDGYRDQSAGRAAADDVLDAGACAWTAQQILDDDVQCMPDPPQFDATGREMAIRV